MNTGRFSTTPPASISPMLAEEACTSTSVLFEDVFKLWLQTMKIRNKPSTYAKYKYMASTHILPVFGNLYINDINAALINEFLLNKLESGRLSEDGGLSATYVRSIMLIIRSVMMFSTVQGYCQAKPLQLYSPQVPKKEICILNHTQQKQLTLYAFENLSSTSLGVLLALYCGLRIGEVCSLSWNDMDFENNTLRVRHTLSCITDDIDNRKKWIIDTPKTTASARMIPIPSTLVEILNAAHRQSDGSFIISNSKEFINPRTFDYRYHRLLEKGHFKSINFHALRHTFATRCVEAGMDVKTLSEILGHSNVGITLNTYVHSSMELKRVQLERMICTV